MLEPRFFPDIPIYVMNLPQRTDRKQHMKQVLSQLGARRESIIISSDNQDNIKMILAKDVKNRQTLIEEKKITDSASDKLNNPYVANALGQLDYVREIVRTGKNSIIMEDDIVPLWSVYEIGHRLQTSIDELPSDADMLYLEICHENCEQIQKVGKTLYKLYEPSCSAAIYFTVKGAKKVLELCMPVFDGIDIMYPKLIRSGDLVAYGISGMLFVQDEYFGSDAERGGEKFKRVHRPRASLCSRGNMDVCSPFMNKYRMQRYIMLLLVVAVVLVLGSLLFFRARRRDIRS